MEVLSYEQLILLGRLTSYTLYKNFLDYVYLLPCVSSSDRTKYNKYLTLKATSIDRFLKIQNRSKRTVMPKLVLCVSFVTFFLKSFKL